MTESIIHLRVQAAVKARWVRESRAAGMTLTDWIISRVERRMNITEIVAEVAVLAEQATDLPIYFKSPQAADGVEAMLQAAQAFQAASDSPARLDAALWLGEAYMLFSRALPDTGRTEQSTGWVTARQIAQLLGGPDVWENRVRAEL
ncbi:MAG: hypothetical protein J0H59_02825 [Comamonadaceae bacterium]|nr:hypothetical protein [Comamonadaceae bacterium]